MKKKSSLFDYFHIVVAIMFITFTTIYLSFVFYQANAKFEKESADLQKEYFNSQKNLLVKEVEKFTDYIENKKSQSYLETQKTVKSRVLEAHALAFSLHEKYKNTHSDAQIEKLIINALRALRYEDNKGYYFIIRMDGTRILATDKPETEGESTLNFKNCEGRSISKGIIDIASSTKEGFYEYTWSKPSETSNHFKKISFVKLFEPYDWIIGTGLYLDDMEEKIKNEIIHNENMLQFDKNNSNFIFIATWDGLSLTYPAKNKNVYNLTDKNGKFIVQELITTSQNGGGFVEYVMPPLSGLRNLNKLSYVVGIPDWRWYVGAGVYLEDVNKEIISLEEEIKKDLKNIVFSILLLLLVFCLLLGVFYFFISRKIKKDFHTFSTFFDSLANKDEIINLKSLEFREFDELAHHANKMLETKMSINKYLEQYKKIVSSSDDLLSLIDKNYIYLAVSEGYLKIFGKEKEEILGHSMPELFGEQYFEENLRYFSDKVLSGESYEREHWVKFDLEERYLHTKYFPYYEKESDVLPSAYVVSSRDITEKKANEDKLLASERELEFLAHNDALTGLPNRILLEDRIMHGINNSKRQGSLLAICFIDFDNFKKINDSFGHSYGDDILKQFALRTHDVTRSTDTLSRIGGDEFILLIENIKDISEIDLIVSKIQNIFETPFICKEQKFFLSASIGISVYPDHGLDSETLIKNADAAMYKAKDLGKNTHAFYTTDMTIASYERIGMENALREAIKEKQFLVYYQPQIDLQTGKVISLEALVRWNHPKEGILAPGRFIVFAEETRLIIEIGAFVLKQACLDLIHLKQEGFGDIQVSINVSGIQIEYSNFLTTLKEVVEETKINPAYLEMEITESFIMNDPKRWIELLKNMQNLGISIAIDDFGTGHSSLSYLRKLPINKLKVDMSFVKDIPAQEDACAIVNSIIDLAHNMKIITIAEGIETHEQEAYLRAHQCMQGQGYFYSKPLNLKDLKKWMKSKA
ncbi:MAG: cache domain-containing protein [Campylobacteraceae bacterium]|nr:cache domain-containing protein [Campylobacteraceae bacterium]